MLHINHNLLNFRERANALFQQQREEQFMRGKQVRQQMEERNTDQRAKVVQKLEVSVTVIYIMAATYQLS